MTYTNISEEWGGTFAGLTLEDYQNQAICFGENPDSLTEAGGCILFDGLPIAVADVDYHKGG
jgi:hypothetical protein